MTAVQRDSRLNLLMKVPYSKLILSYLSIMPLSSDAPYPDILLWFLLHIQVCFIDHLFKPDKSICDINPLLEYPFQLGLMLKKECSLNALLRPCVMLSSLSQICILSWPLNVHFIIYFDCKSIGAKALGWVGGEGKRVLAPLHNFT